MYTQVLTIYFSFQVDFPSPGVEGRLWKPYSFHLSDAAISNNSALEEVQQRNDVYASWSMHSQSHSSFGKKQLHNIN